MTAAVLSNYEEIFSDMRVKIWELADIVPYRNSFPEKDEVSRNQINDR